jgi:hypothetical protein
MNTVFPDSIELVIAKFVSAIVLHWICLPKIQSSLEQMKFVVNHMERFETPFAAYMGAFLCLTAMVAVEMLNMFSLLSVMDLFEFVRDFTALVIIADFDLLMSLTLKESCLRLIIKDERFQKNVLTITRSTSSRFIDSDQDATKKGYALITWRERRSWFSFVGYAFYRLLRVLYVSVWFYYLPLIVFYA